VRYFASLLVRYENAVASHSLEFAAQNAMRYSLSATLVCGHTVLPSSGQFVYIYVCV